MRTLFLVGVLCMLAPESTPARAEPCCKVCTKGKACGNTCIARHRECHKGPGCACDA